MPSTSTRELALPVQHPNQRPLSLPPPAEVEGTLAHPEAAQRDLLQAKQHWTLPLGLTQFRLLYSTNWPPLMAMTVIATIPIVLLYIFFQRYFVAGGVSAAVKGWSRSPFATLAGVHPIPALFRRNAWATERLLDFCEGRPEATAPAEADVYGGIEATFNHILSGETGYLRLLTGELPEDRVRESKPRPLGDLHEPARWLAERWPRALELDRDPEEVLPYQRGDDREVMADWVPLVQCFHHGDDHRTQVGTLLGRHGVEQPELDGWAFGEAAEGEVDSAPKRGSWAVLLRRAFGHHLWATERLLERCRELSPEQLALSAVGTYGSIDATLDHLLSADRSYLSRVMGGPPTPPLEAGGPGPLLEHLARQRDGWLAYLDSGPDFEATAQRREGGQVPAWVVVIQAIHHGNDHRTHVGTVLLSHDLAAPDIDVWNYAWALGALRPLP